MNYKLVHQKLLKDSPEILAAYNYLIETFSVMTEFNLEPKKGVVIQAVNIKCVPAELNIRFFSSSSSNPFSLVVTKGHLLFQIRVNRNRLANDKIRESFSTPATQKPTEHHLYIKTLEEAQLLIKLLFKEILGVRILRPLRK